MYCRLCVRVCEDFKNLYDEDGHQNECYKVTAKYFAGEVCSFDQTLTTYNKNSFTNCFLLLLLQVTRT